MNSRTDSQVNRDEKGKADSQVNDLMPDSQVNRDEKRRSDSQVKRMTVRQRNYIWRLAKKAMAKHRLTMAELRERAREELGVDMGRDMSREDAGRVIDWLKELAGEED